VPGPVSYHHGTFCGVSSGASYPNAMLVLRTPQSPQSSQSPQSCTIVHNLDLASREKGRERERRRGGGAHLQGHSRLPRFLASPSYRRESQIERTVVLSFSAWNRPDCDPGTVIEENAVACSRIPLALHYGILGPGVGNGIERKSCCTAPRWVTIQGVDRRWSRWWW
jgi:hypothetical protein